MRKSVTSASLGERLLFPALSDRAVFRAMWALILAGCLLRLAWTLHGHLNPINSEAFFIARALAEGRGFSEAFGLGTGPTAHLMPLTPLPAAAAYMMFGVGSPAAELALTIWGLAMLVVSLIAAEAVLRELGAPPLARLAAVGIVAIFPIQYSLELEVFRVWEGGAAAAGLLLILLAVLRIDRREVIGWKTLVGLGLANGATFLISPAAAIGASGAIGVLFLRRVSWRAWWLPVVAALCLVLVVLVPWGLRNERVLGQFVPLRTGEGISMALAYYDGRSSDADIQATDLRRFREVSPLMGDAARQRYLQVGEIAYNRELARTTTAWTAAHPAEVWKIRARNFIQFFAPPAWLWTRFTKSAGSFTEIRQYLVALASIAAGLTVTVALVRRRYRWVYVAAALVLPSLPYVMTYPLLRYRYLISTLLIFVAVTGAWQLLAWLTRRRSEAA